MKFKRLLWGLSIIFIGIMIITFLTNDSTKLTQINVITQLVYTYVTTLMVIMTYEVLKATQEQKHQSVRPYLLATDFGFWKNAQENNREELDFEIYNEGIGIALSLYVIVKKKESEEILYESSYTRLAVQDNNEYGALCQIRDEINHIRNNNDRNGTYSYSPYIPNYIHIEIPIEGDIQDYLSFIVELSFNDIYEKAYITVFDVKMDEEEREAIECVERFVEM